MRKLERLKKILKLVKLQEHDVLIEFKQLQTVNSELTTQINDLAQHRSQSTQRLIQQSIHVSQINVVRRFANNIEIVLEQLNNQLNMNNQNFMIVAEKLKETRSRIKSIEQLIERNQKLADFDEQKRRQQQLEENINFSLSIDD